MQNDLTNIPCGTLGVQLRSLAQRNQGMLLTVAGASVAALLILPTASAAGSIQILFGLACVMAAWLSARHASIPIVLIVGLQTAVVYGLPIVTRNEALEDYPEAAIARGATEVMLFCIALAIAWTAGFGHRGRLARRCHMFAFVANRTNRKLPRLALMLQALDELQLVNRRLIEPHALAEQCGKRVTLPFVVTAEQGYFIIGRQRVDEPLHFSA